MSSPESSVTSLDSQPVREVEYPVGVQTEVPDTNGGLFKTVLIEGSGTKPIKGSKVTVHYVGTLESDGSKFDSSRDRGEYFEFTLGRGQVIKGWDRGVATMRVGEKAVLRCTPEYGYGAAGSPPKIPANATLLFEVELFSWTREEDISESKDKSIMKSLAVEGIDYEKPGYESKLKVDLRVYAGPHSDDQPGTLLCERLDWELTLGDTPLPPHLETCLSTMRKRESASFRIDPRLSTEHNEEFNISPGSQLTYAVELRELTTVKTWMFEGPARVEEAERRRAQGNEAVRSGKFSVAERKYRRALEFVEADSGFGSDNDESLASARKVRLVLWGNLAQALLAQGSHQECIRYCNRVLEVEPGNAKALFRRAKAYDAQSDWHEAKGDLETILQADPQNTDARVLLQRVQAQRKAYEKKQREAYKKMFS
ncbi:FK506-binding protein (FKBP)-type peptidyl-prolyl isomerase, putative [Trypanosoma equiperdum]|uniref:peptidylprolyl isomerase n=4 Tax=Trypanozoon TaxID=39700 RepID=Q387Q5_TRYB2|nr:peptidylprolyl isomerase-like protein, putative [Trypanosoma brucei gambiense DAL972]XP_828079.1 peptidylprolyl isomerase-like protein, putative [Trypanosoma brucei brucei TREU927]RHW69848.1 peptidylprolyl isomerase-like protein [Trypanosoma brucei equiperdum]SCU66498.1 FK506-binding protein (FKBP)-type peptidyl-prolyl isomerase, putative [Trypanosoma equiperdum]EAN78967.1 peptidylprolyl isomerase-like protein, putative [Trypanosoma brucei brucei TREU927]CBH16863.1 peptidylprolyl isomerase-|eukprot:XP_011779127.1 peptidylprolyl isomerase-like protein, putative [Trypanosoma brucei gambiense DAL972]